MLASSTLFLMLVLILVLKIRSQNEGHFIYALDDPYIHLAISEQIARGHYGINPSEAASASSSILWPFLLTPFAGHPTHAYLPLVLNLIFGVVAVCLIAFAVDRWMSAERDRRSDWWMKLLITLLVMLTGNLVSLTLVGMEHVLQVLLSVACAIGITFAFEDAVIPSWCLAAAVLAPLVRYEDLTLTAAVCLVLAAVGQKFKAAVLFVAAVIPLVLFGLFLRHLGLPMLPTSVLVKASSDTHGNMGLVTAYQLIRTNLHLMRVDASRWPVLALAVILTTLWFADQNRMRRVVLGSGLLVAALHIAFGRFGWFYRYEVYAVVFLTLIFVWAVCGRRNLQYAPLALGLFYVGSQYVSATAQTVSTSGEIYRQQYQMHRFVADYYRKSVAVNDIGLVSYARPPGVYVLDLVGLGSIEIIRAREHSPQVDG